MAFRLTDANREIDELIAERDALKAALAKAEQERDAALADVKTWNGRTVDMALYAAHIRPLACEEAARLMDLRLADGVRQELFRSSEIRALAELTPGLVAVDVKAMERVKASANRLMAAIPKHACETYIDHTDTAARDDLRAALSALESEASR